jgi:hypothetical protein
MCLAIEICAIRGISGVDSTAICFVCNTRQRSNPTLSAMLFKINKLPRLMNPLAGACFVFGMSDMQFCEAQLRAVKAKTESLVISFSIGEEEFCRTRSERADRRGHEKSELLVNNRLRAHPFRGPNTTPTSHIYTND